MELTYLHKFENAGENEERRVAQQRQRDLMAAAADGQGLPTFFDERKDISFTKATRRRSTKTVESGGGDGSARRKSRASVGHIGHFGPDAAAATTAIFREGGTSNDDDSVSSLSGGRRKSCSSSSSTGTSAFERELAHGTHTPSLDMMEKARQFLWEEDEEENEPLRGFRAPGREPEMYGVARQPSLRSIDNNDRDKDRGGSNRPGSGGSESMLPEKDIGSRLLSGLRPTFGPGGDVPSRARPAIQMTQSFSNKVPLSSTSSRSFNIAPRRNSTHEIDKRARGKLRNNELSDVEYEYDGTYGTGKYAGYDDESLPPLNSTDRGASGGFSWNNQFLNTFMAKYCSALVWKDVREAACFTFIIVSIAVFAIAAPRLAASDSKIRTQPERDSRLEAISKRITFAGVSTANLLKPDRVHTPQRQALEWLVFEDPMVIDPGDEHLLQRYALAVLWYSMETTDWKNSERWLTGDGICSWFGVTCHPHSPPGDEKGSSGNGRVTHIDLKKNGLMGTLPQELFNCLTSLQGLDLHDNKLVGTIGESVGALKDLVDLVLRSNSFTGSIPDNITELVKLSTLDLSNNNFEGTLSQKMSFLSDSLTELSLFGNALTGSIPENFGSFKKLAKLYLDSNNLTGTIPTSLGQLSQLLDLRLQENHLDGQIPTELGRLRQVEKVYLDTNILTGSLPRELGGLENLDELSLFENRLQGTLPVELGQLSELRHLYLDGNFLTGSIPPEWGARWGVLRHLYLGGNNLTGAIPIQTSSMQDLEILQLGGGNQLSGSIPTEMGNMVRLEHMSLELNKLSGTVPEQLGLLVNLEELLLHGNNLTGDIPDSICQLTNKSLAEFTAQCAGGKVAPIRCACCSECF